MFLRCRLKNWEDETEVADNARVTSEMEVVDEKVKVLLVAGEASWDYQHVYKLLQRDQTISLSCWLQTMDETRPQEGNAPISRLPRTIDELGAYNVVMMFDPNPEEFDENWMDLLKDFCKFKAGGNRWKTPQHTGNQIPYLCIVSWITAKTHYRMIKVVIDH